jgi:serine/threonine protein kinase
MFWGAHRIGPVVCRNRVSRLPVSTSSSGYFGPYRLLNSVHTGQTSQIWQAYHDGKQQVFGLKILLQKYRRNREHMAFLRWEYTVGHDMDHERIIRLHEFGNDRGNFYLAMEWFSAPNMKNRIHQGIERIAHLVPKIIEQAAEGLAYFNQFGWVHRDVKPDNFLVNDDGDVKLIDFALAQRSSSGLRRLLSPKSKIQGTRSYMSPEQIRGTALDQRADVYAFGCTVHELLAGKPPFTGVSANELLNKHLKASPPSLEAVDKNITPEFAQLVHRSLSKDPADRPQSVNDFLLELRRHRVFRRIPQPPEQTAAEREESKDRL